MVILSGITTHGVLLALAVRELIVLRRYRGDGGDRPRDPEPVVPPRDDSPSQRPLPPCLRPEFMDLRPDPGIRLRVLEPA